MMLKNRELNLTAIIPKRIFQRIDEEHSFHFLLLEIDSLVLYLITVVYLFYYKKNRDI